MTPLDSEVQAHVTAVSYKPHTRTGYLRLSHRHVPDMTGTVSLFTRITSDVQLILVYDGRHLNTQYSKIGDQWKCTRTESTWK